MFIRCAVGNFPMGPELLGRNGGRRQCAQLVVKACLLAATGQNLQNKRTESWEYLLLAYDVATEALRPSVRVLIIECVAAALAQEGLREEAIKARQCVLELLQRDGGTNTVAYHVAQVELTVAKAEGGHGRCRGVVRVSEVAGGAPSQRSSHAGDAAPSQALHSGPHEAGETRMWKDEPFPL